MSQGQTESAPFPPECARKYRPVRMVGSGAFGKVWLATQLELDRPVAIKLLQSKALEDPEQTRRFCNEARVTASLSHPNVVVLIDQGAESGLPWIAYEYLAGRTLRHILESGRMPWPEAVRAASQIAAALEAAHDKRILHRDIKPENVIEAAPGSYKVTDFGIAKWRDDEFVQTGTGVILGTPAYLSPEQIRCGKTTVQSDVYALGVTFYELLTGTVPFEGETVVDLMDRHLNAAPRPPADQFSDIPQVVSRIVLKSLAKAPLDRYRTARAMREALEGVDLPEGGSEAARSPDTGTGVQRRKMRTRVSNLPRLRDQQSTIAIPPSRRRPALWIAAFALLALGFGIWKAVPKAQPLVRESPSLESPLQRHRRESPAKAPVSLTAKSPMDLTHDPTQYERQHLEETLGQLQGNVNTRWKTIIQGVVLVAEGKPAETEHLLKQLMPAILKDRKRITDLWNPVNGCCSNTSKISTPWLSFLTRAATCRFLIWTLESRTRELSLLAQGAREIAGNQVVSSAVVASLNFTYSGEGARYFDDHLILAAELFERLARSGDGSEVATLVDEVCLVARAFSLVRMFPSSETLYVDALTRFLRRLIQIRGPVADRLYPAIRGIYGIWWSSDRPRFSGLSYNKVATMIDQLGAVVPDAKGKLEEIKKKYLTPAVKKGR